MISERPLSSEVVVSLDGVYSQIALQDKGNCRRPKAGANQRVNLQPPPFRLKCKMFKKYKFTVMNCLSTTGS